MGKYSGVVGKLPKLPLDADKTDEYRRAVDLAKEAFVDRTPAGLALAYKAAREKKSAHEAAERAINVEVRAVEVLMFKAFEDAGVESLNLTGGGSVAVDVKISTKIVDKRSAIAWLKANGLEEVLTVNAQTLGAMVGERLLDGKAIPDGVEVGSYPSARLNK